MSQYFEGSSWSWSYGIWIYNYLCNQWLSPLQLWVWIQLRQGVLDTTLCDKVCQWLVTGQCFSLGTPVSSTNKTDCHDIAEILLKVALNTIKQTNKQYFDSNDMLVFIYLFQKNNKTINSCTVNVASSTGYGLPTF